MLSSTGLGLGVLGIQQAIAQTPISIANRILLPISLVSTNEDASVYTIRRIPGYQPRFSNAVGSGALLLNTNREVTGYYFIINHLNMRTSYAYRFHAATRNHIPTSCEGERAFFEGETAGDVILDLGAIAPLESSRRGVAFVGSPRNPIELPQPIPVADIGYLNIHSMQDSSTRPSMACANIRLNPGGFER
jgi:hypothetical protein